MTVDLRRGTPTPSGPDPYKIVVQDLEHIKTSIKKVLSENKGGSGALSSNEVLTMAAREFMQRKGKSFRPMLVLLIGRATNPDFAINQRHYKLAVIAEMIHTASLIHADVLEEGESDTSQGTLVHQEVNVDVGNKVCILAGDFLLAKAAVELSLLDCSEVTEIVARGLEAICEGSMLAYDSTAHAAVAAADGLRLEEYLHVVERQQGQLIGNTCQCSAILSGHEVNSSVAQACKIFGEGLAMAQQLIGEADEMSELLKKSRRAPRKWPSTLPPTVPLLRAVQSCPELGPIISRGFAETEDAAAAIALIDSSDAVNYTLDLATQHAQDAADALFVLPDSAMRSSMLVLCHKILAGVPLK
uniref:Uncharacterized protein n=1 Tax=Calcidiscus leptoporus TaxID=127549 RepID=A0A7S0IXC1_9EUKA